MPKSYSYIRFSTPEQGKGDSLRRQTQAAIDYSLLHNLDFDDSLTFEDKGISSYRGANLSGKLGEFFHAVTAGIVPAGSYLLVENFDRISRQGLWDAFPVFQLIINSGIILVTLQDGQVYSKQLMSDNSFHIFAPLLSMIRAHGESSAKSDRLSKAWQAKRSNILSKPLTSVAPAWLKLDKQKNQFEIIKDRVEIVREIFDLTLSGMGQESIVKHLISKNVQTFSGRIFWQRSYIHKILHNRSVIGEYTPHLMHYDDILKKKIRKPLEPISDYFPKIISDEMFNSVHLLSKKDNFSRNRTSLKNMLTGVALCPYCSAKLLRKSYGTGKKSGKPKLICSKAKVGLCVYRSVEQERVEDFFVKALSIIFDHQELSKEYDEDKTFVINQEIQSLKKDIDSLSDAIIHHGFSKSLSEKLLYLETSLDEKQLFLSQTIQNQYNGSFEIVKRRQDQLIDLFNKDSIDVGQASVLIRQLLTSIIVDFDCQDMVFNFINGDSINVKKIGDFFSIDY